MYGSRAQLGILVPSKIVVVEPECIAMAPEGVTCHFHRFVFLAGTAGLAPGEPVEPSRIIDEIKGLGARAVEASEVISHINPSAVAMA